MLQLFFHRLNSYTLAIWSSHKAIVLPRIKIARWGFVGGGIVLIGLCGICLDHCPRVVVYNRSARKQLSPLCARTFTWDLIKLGLFNLPSVRLLLPVMGSSVVFNYFSIRLQQFIFPFPSPVHIFTLCSLSVFVFHNPYVSLQMYE